MVIMLYANIIEQNKLHCIIYYHYVRFYSLSERGGELIVNIYEGREKVGNHCPMISI